MINLLTKHKCCDEHSEHYARFTERCDDADWREQKCEEGRSKADKTGESRHQALATFGTEKRYNPSSPSKCENRNHDDAVEQEELCHERHRDRCEPDRMSIDDCVRRR